MLSISKDLIKNKLVNVVDSLTMNPFLNKDDIKVNLESTKVPIKRVAMRSLIHHMSLGEDMSHLFISVIKNVSHEDPHIRKMVFIYIMHYGSLYEEETLLVVSSLQRLLKNPDPVLRGDSLKVITSLSIKSLVAIMVVSVKDAIVDSSNYVKSAAALGMIKIYKLDENQREILTEYINTLLDDNEPWVLGDCMRAFIEVCPHRLDFLHQRFRKLLKIAIKAQPFGQKAIIEAFILYCRTFFPNPNSPRPDEESSEKPKEKLPSESDQVQNEITFSPKEPKDPDLFVEKPDQVQNETESSPKEPKDLVNSTEENNHEYLSFDGSENSIKDPCVPGEGDSTEIQFWEEPTSQVSENVANKETSLREILESLENDRKSLLDCCLDLLHTDNCSVISSVFRLMFYCGPDEYCSEAVKFLILASCHNYSAQMIILKLVISAISERKQVFEPYISSFFIFPNDSAVIQSLKFEIIVSLISENNYMSVIDEFEAYLNYGDVELGIRTIQAIGKVITFNEHVTSTCTVMLLQMFSKCNDALIGETTIVMKNALESEGVDKKSILKLFIIYLDKINNVEARVSILWVISEHCKSVKKWLPDVLRKCARSFVDEPEAVKLQIVNLASKLAVVSRKKCLNIAQYIFTLAKYDDSYFLRDRIRILSHIVSLCELPQSEVSSPLVERMKKRVLFGEKHTPVVGSTFKGHTKYQLSTLSSFLGYEVCGYQSSLPEWPVELPDHTLRLFKFELPSILESEELASVSESEEEEEEYSDEEDEEDYNECEKFIKAPIEDEKSSSDDEDDEDSD